MLLLIVFVKTTIDAMDPAAGSGSNIAGIGLVGLIGVAVLGIGVVLMLLQAKKSPEFFSGKVLAKADATQDTSMLETFDDGLSG